MHRSVNIAKSISTGLNPFPLSVMVLLMAIYIGSDTLLESGKWFAIILSFIVILPLTYIYIRTATERPEARQIPNPLEFFRKHRKELGIIAFICATPCILLLIYLDAPQLLYVTLIALLVTSLAVTVVNWFFRASYHLSIATVTAITLVIVWGPVALPIALFITVLIGWAKYSLRQHSSAQLAAGVGVALIIATACFYFFGLLK